MLAQELKEKQSFPFLPFFFSSVESAEQDGYTSSSLFPLPLLRKGKDSSSFFSLLSSPIKDFFF